MIQALELFRLAKTHVSDGVTRISEEIRPVPLAISELRLSEGICQIVSQSVEILLNKYKENL